MERRLSAILAADVVGYSALMEKDEAGTFERLRAHRKELFEPEINRHHGRIFKLMGDGLLAEFGSVVDAVECAAAVQRDMTERNAGVEADKRIEVRIGINLGDVIVEGKDLHGEGVNIAARLQQLALTGGICVSGKVAKEVEKKVAFAFEAMGEQRMKNIAEPILVFRMVPAKPALNSLEKSPLKDPLPLPDKPSIAVLPFQNMSGDPEQEYFADGMVEEIIIALSRMRWLFVIARNSSFTYKGRAVDVKQVGRELGVRYVLEGSVRKAGTKVRITGQLIDVSTGAHLWAERFDGGLEDVFDLQDQVTASVVGAISPKLEQAEVERAKRKTTESLDAYDYYLRGMASAVAYTREGYDEALSLFYNAIELDPGFAAAYGMASWCFVTRKSNGWMADRAREAAEGARLARQAVKDREDAIALSWGGFALAYLDRDLDGGIAYVERALDFNPNLAAAWYMSGWLRVYSGEPKEAMQRLERALRLSPLDPLIFRVHAGMAYAHFFAGRYDEATVWAEKALRERPTWLTTVRIAAASHAMAGRLDKARILMTSMRELDPVLRMANLNDLLPLRQPKDYATWADALRKAGLPE